MATKRKSKSLVEIDMTPSPPTWARPPESIILKIFDHLKYTELLGKASCVNRYWRRISLSKYQWRKVLLANPSITLENLNQLVVRNLIDLHTEELIIELVGFPLNPEKVLVKLFDKTKNLKSFRLVGGCVIEWWKFFDNVPETVEKLIVRSLQSSNMVVHLRPRQGRTRSYKHVELIDLHWLQLMHLEYIFEYQDPELLTHVCIEYCPNIFPRAIEHQQRLGDGIGKWTCDYLRTNWNKVKHLHLVGDFFNDPHKPITGDELVRELPLLIQSQPHLNYLDLSENHNPKMKVIRNRERNFSITAKDYSDLVKEKLGPDFEPRSTFTLVIEDWDAQQCSNAMHCLKLLVKRGNPFKLVINCWMSTGALDWSGLEFLVPGDMLFFDRAKSKYPWAGRELIVRWKMTDTRDELIPFIAPLRISDVDNRPESGERTD